MAIARSRVAIAALSGIALKAILLFGVLPLFLETFTDAYHADLFPDDYDVIAWNLVSGDGYRLSPDTAPTIERAPGWVLVLAAVFACFGKSLLAVQILNLAFSLATAHRDFPFPIFTAMNSNRDQKSCM